MLPRQSLFRTLPFLSLWCVSAGFAVASSAVAAEVDFAHQVVPILRQHCVECHGGREAKGGFSLNTRELLVNSGHVEVGKPDASYLIELINSDDPELRMPPADRPAVERADREILTRWIAQGAAWDDGISFADTAYEPPLRPRRPELPAITDGHEHPVDRIIDDYLARNQQLPLEPIDDAAFLRRVSLDLVGLLPDPETLRAFVADPAADKRQRMIDRLLADEIAFADHWMTFFNDLLRNDYSGTGFITGGRAQISGWLYDALLQNKPFDRFVRELIAPPTAASRGFIDGIRWRGEVSAGQTVEIQFAQSISQSFLGINLKCASCHDSFIDRWTLDEAFGLAAIYADQPLDIHRCDKPIGRTAEAGWLFPEIGQVDPEASRDDRLRQLADLMTHPENGRFTRTIVNRLWYQLMGRGIVHPLDAMQSEPWDADLLDFLAVSLADHDYDLKAILKLIATSRAYQSQTPPESTAVVGEFVFRGPIARRMTAEQFLDSVWQLTDAAPTRIDAPVLRGIVDDAEVERLSLQADWIWGDSAADGLPPGGEAISLRKTFSLPSLVERGGAVISCDNAFVLYVNGREVTRGDDWSQPQSVVLTSLLKKGDNQIVVVATNAGTEPNPAGLFFESRLALEGGDELTLVSDDSWQFNPAVPKGREGRLGGIPGDWMPVTVVPSVAAWDEAIRSQAPSRLAQATSENVPMNRAALMKNDFLMKSLGRPLREQIVSMRPADLTTLEAIDLANGKILADALAVGAQRFSQRSWDTPAELVRHVFEFALSRSPSGDELAVITDFIGDSPEPRTIEDFLWAVLMTPEFLLVR